MIFRQDLADHLEKRFERLGHKMPEINLRQAYVIDGCEVLPNPNGSAVGMYLEPDAKSFAMFPGPPREMQPMFSEHVFPKLRARAGQIFVRRKVLRVSGMGESAIDQAIAPIYTEYTSVQTSILFNRSEVEVHLSAKGENESEAGQLLSKLADKIAEKLGIAVFAMNGEIMEEVVGNLLSDNGKTLAVAESCTGGLISQRLTDIPGSSQYFIEGAVTYANEAKIRALGVPAGLFAEHGAVSAEVAEAMAVGIREKADTDFGISVTGIAGPDGGTEEKPVGLVFIGYSGADGSKAYRFVFPGDRYLIRWRSSQAALDILRRKLLKTNG
jgi:nicotinamide-nucleotide amidase